MRVFVSLIVWLFSVTGTDGTLTVKPSHTIAMKRTSANFACATDHQIMLWYQKIFPEKTMIKLVETNCNNTAKGDYDVRPSQEPDTPGYRCDLIVKPTAKVYSGGLSMQYICEDYIDIGDKDSSVYAILIFLESPLKCEVRETQLSCTLQHSAYMNTSEMFQYLEIKLEMKSPTGTIVSSKSAGFMDKETVITVPLDGGKSFPTTNPYICSARFTRHCDEDSEEDCVENITILSPSAVECKYHDTNWWTTTTTVKTKAIDRPIVTVEASEIAPAMKFHDHYRAMGAIMNIEISTPSGKDSDAEGGTEAGLAAARAFVGTTTRIRIRSSNSRLERDGVDSIVMLTSLLVAFLVQ